MYIYICGSKLFSVTGLTLWSVITGDYIITVANLETCMYLVYLIYANDNVMSVQKVIKRDLHLVGNDNFYPSTGLIPETTT